MPCYILLFLALLRRRGT